MAYRNSGSSCESGLAVQITSLHFAYPLRDDEQSINQFISHKPCTIGTLVPAATVPITGKRSLGGETFLFQYVDVFSTRNSIVRSDTLSVFPILEHLDASMQGHVSENLTQSQPGVTAVQCIDLDGLCLASKGPTNELSCGLLSSVYKHAQNVEDVDDFPVVVIEQDSSWCPLYAHRTIINSGLLVKLGFLQRYATELSICTCHLFNPTSSSGHKAYIHAIVRFVLWGRRMSACFATECEKYEPIGRKSPSSGIIDWKSHFPAWILITIIIKDSNISVDTDALLPYNHKVVFGSSQSIRNLKHADACGFYPYIFKIIEVSDAQSCYSDSLHPIRRSVAGKLSNTPGFLLTECMRRLTQESILIAAKLLEMLRKILSGLRNRPIGNEPILSITLDFILSGVHVLAGITTRYQCVPATELISIHFALMKCRFSVAPIRIYDKTSSTDKAFANQLLRLRLNTQPLGHEHVINSVINCDVIHPPVTEFTSHGHVLALRVTIAQTGGLLVDTPLRIPDEDTTAVQCFLTFQDSLSSHAGKNRYQTF
ncbi:hypothetical protein CLF_101954 [Clonorchis sinensis]|uniref:Uncharacterized protein n=1 Tax=Clonorchis sinensis TaxID=79923 RepID=G7Y6Y7_CLOSI|nr:hypothetical protein CLF_101954 [Clonorchis sinensis]